MVSSYHEEDLLPLSGIQHFAYCERQWALIHVESQWIENLGTAEGRLLHQRVDDPYFTESRGDVKIERAIPLISTTLGLYGVADLMEIHQKHDNAGVSYSIVEYKRGKPKPDDRDEVQLCAQAICLEEMRGIALGHGYMYYGKTKHRHHVTFTTELRGRVLLLSKRMHYLYAKGETPKAVKGKRCKNCSMSDICLPKLGNIGRKVEQYIANLVEEALQD